MSTSSLPCIARDETKELSPECIFIQPTQPTFPPNHSLNPLNPPTQPTLPLNPSS